MAGRRLNASMGQGAVTVGPAFVAVLVALVVLAALVTLAGQRGLSRGVVTASARAVLQLGAVSLLITAVLRSWWATAGFIALMTGVAAVTSARRGAGSPRRGWPARPPLRAG